MNNGQSLNLQIVHDAAAHLFWSFAEKVGVPDANNTVITSRGQCLLKQPFTTQILGQYGLDNLPKDKQTKFGNAITLEALRFSIKEENMLGIIYADDAQVGRSPSAKHIDASVVKAVPKRISSDSHKIKKVGHLCLRHPLPAVVFLNTESHESVIEVGDTTVALGFNLPMYLAYVNCQKIRNGLFVLSGIFYIPVQDRIYGDLWNGIIQNSIRFVGGMTFVMGPSSIEVQADW